LSHEDVAVLAKMIAFLYTFDYDVESFTPLLLHASLHSLAIKYEIAELQRLTEARLEEELLQKDRVQTSCSALISAVYNGTFLDQRRLRGPLVNYISRNLKSSIEDSDFQQVHKEKSDFAFDLLRCMYKNDASLNPAGDERSGAIAICHLCVAAETKYAAGEPMEYAALISQHADDSKEFNTQWSSGLFIYQKATEYKKHLHTMKSLTIRHDFAKDSA